MVEKKGGCEGEDERRVEEMEDTAEGRMGLMKAGLDVGVGVGLNKPPGLGMRVNKRVLIEVERAD